MWCYVLSQYHRNRSSTHNEVKGDQLLYTVTNSGRQSSLNYITESVQVCILVSLSCLFYGVLLLLKFPRLSCSLNGQGKKPLRGRGENLILLLFYFEKIPKVYFKRTINYKYFPRNFVFYILCLQWVSLYIIDSSSNL